MERSRSDVVWCWPCLARRGCGPTHVLANFCCHGPQRQCSFLVPISLDRNKIFWLAPTHRALRALKKRIMYKTKSSSRDKEHVANINDILPCIHWTTCNMDMKDCPTRLRRPIPPACYASELNKGHLIHTWKSPHFTPFCAVFRFLGMI